ncbi:E3 ubiquitin-protein ligase makorin-2-like [Lampris incognitus]|uniref:E3 ubiquitin-protein ligase makorin-2-like n=1 Tax=Lampris incognitus TaxID=2546036 RepID=UPI0024B59388|nr:E3 ubiquitin-protein ligase makorin-2-like [Lampris incognitus]
MEQYPAVRAGDICRQFVNGYCRFGSRCRYLHDCSVMPSTQICRYFQKGACWYGDGCRYLHVLQSDGDAAVASRRGSAPHIHSSCVGNALPGRRGSEPVLSQAQTVSSQAHRASVFNVSHLTTTNVFEERSRAHLPQQGAESNLKALQESQSSATEAGASDGSSRQETLLDKTAEVGAAAFSSPDQRQTEAFLQSKDVTCSICMEKVYDKTSPEARRFGILPNCNHSYCLECIVTWRKTKDLQEEVIKSCPQCRVKSAFYVPYKYWVEGQAKEALITTFKEKCSKRRCVFYTRRGDCPFKSECIYWHDKSQWRRTSQLFLFCHYHQSRTEDVENLDGQQLLDFVIAMTLLWDLEDDDDKEDDSDFVLIEFFLVS